MNKFTPWLCRHVWAAHCTIKIEKKLFSIFCAPSPYYTPASAEPPFSQSAYPSWRAAPEGSLAQAWSLATHSLAQMSLSMVLLPLLPPPPCCPPHPHHRQRQALDSKQRAAMSKSRPVVYCSFGAYSLKILNPGLDIASIYILQTLDLNNLRARHYDGTELSGGSEQATMSSQLLLRKKQLLENLYHHK